MKICNIILCYTVQFVNAPFPSIYERFVNIDEPN